MFANSSSTARQAAIGALMNTRMTGRNVRENCLKMMGHISTAEVMGAKLDQDMKIDMILESLPSSFGQFKMYPKVNKHRKQLRTKFKKLKNKNIMKRLVIHLNRKTWILLYMYNNRCSKLVVGD